MARFAPKGWINGIDFEWGDLFAKYANDVIAGTWKSEAVIGDLNSGTATLAGWGKNVPVSVQQLVATKKKDFLNGSAHVFQGPIYDQQGTLRVKADELATPQGEADFINNDSWLAEGVIGQTK